MDNTKYSQSVQSLLEIIKENYYKNPELALKYCEDIIVHGKEIQNESLIALGYYHKGVILYIRNDGTRFYEAVTNAISHLSKVEDWELLARCYNFLGIFSTNRGNAILGMEYYFTAINACNMIGEDNFKSMVMINLGMLNILYDRYDDAIEILKNARDYFVLHPEHPRYEEYMVGVYQDLAKAYLGKGELTEAKKCFEYIYANHADYLDDIRMLVVWATEATYYHLAGDDTRCEALIAKIHDEMTKEVSIMDVFDDIYDYCKMVLLVRDKKDELWKILEILEPNVKKLDVANIVLKMLALKIEYYRKYASHEEFLQATAQYYEYCICAGVENRNAMNNVLNIRKSLELVNREKEEMAEKNALLQKKSETDALTGLNNRYGLNEYAEAAFYKALDKGTSLAIEILDMDHFKDYNDANGHQKGDECIQKVAATIKSMEEFGAYAARYGGDEFILIYENISKEQMLEYVVELRKRVMDLNIETHSGKEKQIVTISQGVCWDIPVKGNRVWDYLHAADDMLYRVKQKKRNNFCVGNLKETDDQIVMSCF
ncbi:MAG: diguanylate cyclase [Agathobacter sp.]|nr:diguanylate cyclase [Agathobacter sp.]